MVLETMGNLEEATIALHAAQKTGLPVIVSFVIGVNLESAAAIMEAEGAFAIGANCGNGIESFLPVCQRLRAATKLPVWIKANAGLPEIVNGKAIYKTTPEEFASQVISLIGAGANFVGGCCGTTPAFIRAAAERLKSI